MWEGEFALNLEHKNARFFILRTIVGKTLVKHTSSIFINEITSYIFFLLSKQQTGYI